MNEQEKIARLEEQVRVLGELFIAQLEVSQNLAAALQSDNKDFRDAVFTLYRMAMSLMRERMVTGLDRMMDEVKHG